MQITNKNGGEVYIRRLLLVSQLFMTDWCTKTAQ